MTNYKVHTLQCARNMIKCAECDLMIGTAEDAMQLHKMEFHTLRVCDQCQVSIEAYKLPEHKVNRVWLFLNDVQVQSSMTLILEHCTECMFLLKDLMYILVIWLIFGTENWVWKSNFGDFRWLKWKNLIKKLIDYSNVFDKNLHSVGFATLCSESEVTLK